MVDLSSSLSAESQTANMYFGQTFNFVFLLFNSWTLLVPKANFLFCLVKMYDFGLRRTKFNAFSGYN